MRACPVVNPRSSTHCELVGLALALERVPPPPQILTDSLVSLWLLRRWWGLAHAAGLGLYGSG